MAHKKNGPAHRHLTEVELELMAIIWQVGVVTVKDVINALPKARALAYTSVATVMKILEQKKYLACNRNSSAHTYSALITKEEYERCFVDQVVDNLFGGEPVALIQRLLDGRNLSVRDVHALEETLKQLSKRRKETP
jgi:predicted transcriptional regulator